MRDHRKLKVFTLADELAVRVYELTNRFPAHERFGLTAQARRAAVSVAANIVEAAARTSKADYVRMLTIAYGSARELEYQLTLAVRLGFLKPELATSVLDLSCQTSKALRRLISVVSSG